MTVLTQSEQISVTPQIGHRSVLLIHLIGIIYGVLRKRCFMETSGLACADWITVVRFTGR